MAPCKSIEAVDRGLVMGSSAEICSPDIGEQYCSTLALNLSHIRRLRLRLLLAWIYAAHTLMLLTMSPLLTVLTVPTMPKAPLLAALALATRT